MRINRPSTSIPPLLAGIALLITPLLAAAADPGLPAFTSTPGPGGGQTYTLTIQTLLFMTALTFLPAVILMMTSFIRIVIVLSLLRQAIGTMQAPPNQVLLGLSLFLTFFVMSPVLDRIYVDAYQPFVEQKLDFVQAVEKGAVPLKAFMLRQTRQEDLALFVRLSNSEPLQSPDAVPMKVLIPSYVISELKTAFQIGFLLYLPFLVIDLVIASILMALGMMMLSPMLVSLPVKLLLFVLVDGWALTVKSLATTYMGG